MLARIHPLMPEQCLSLATISSFSSRACVAVLGFRSRWRRCCHLPKRRWACQVGIFHLFNYRHIQSGCKLILLIKATFRADLTAAFMECDGAPYLTAYSTQLPLLVDSHLAWGASKRLWVWLGCAMQWLCWFKLVVCVRCSGTLSSRS